MNTIKYAIFIGCGAALIIASCAVSPDPESRRRAIEEDIAIILSVQLDPAEFGETKRCLAKNEYRNFRILDDRHILFEGRRDRQWINTLRSRCPELRYSDVLVMRPSSGTRMCNMDAFQVADWFDWPWYQRWPWQWGGGWGTGARCSLGKFQPVTKAQVEKIEALIETR